MTFEVALPFRRGDDISTVIVDINLPGIKYWHKYCFTGATTAGGDNTRNHPLPTGTRLIEQQASAYSCETCDSRLDPKWRIFLAWGNQRSFLLF